MTETVLFIKEYNGESLYDLERDVSEAICEDYNEAMEALPVDEKGFTKGNFKVSITWREEE